MPYIHEDDRAELRLGRSPDEPGELNFVICNLVDAYLAQNYAEPGYYAFNEVIGALECAKLEIYRRLVVPYEKRKRRENGDVFTVAER